MYSISKKKYNIIDLMDGSDCLKIQSIRTTPATLPKGIDLYQLNRAVSFLRSIKLKEQMILFVNTSDACEPDVIASLTSFKTNQAYLQGKWIPGLLSNWNSMNNTIKSFRKSKTVFRYAAINDWRRYKDKSVESRFLRGGNNQISNIKILTKYQQAKKNHLLGIAKFLRRPSLVVILGVDSNSLAAVREAQRSGIPTIGIASMNTLEKYPRETILSCITYPITYHTQINLSESPEPSYLGNDKKSLLHVTSEYISDLLLEDLPRIKYFKSYIEKLIFIIMHTKLLPEKLVLDKK